MFRPATLFIGLRYTRAKSRNQFISLISCITILGIALGVAVLITVLSVVNGFDREIKKQIFGMIAPVTITSMTGKMDNWQKVLASVKKNPAIKGVAPFISEDALITNAEVTMPAMLIGVLPELENQVSDLSQKMIAGQLKNLQPGEFGIVLGEELAKKLKVNPGDKLILATLQGSSSITKILPKFNKFTVTGIFHAGGGALGFDSRMAFIHLADAQQLVSLHNSISGLHINIDNLYAAPVISLQLASQLPEHLSAWNWTQQLGGFFENIRMTKTMMFFIFVLIIAVAAFNLVCTMVMVVKNKEMDIAILRTLGATPQMVLIIFTVQGVLIALSGTILGILGGVLLSVNVSSLSTWIQDILHRELVSSNIYFVNYLPAELQWQDIGIISVVAIGLSLISSLYPAFKAARMVPVEILNSE